MARRDRGPATLVALTTIVAVGLLAACQPPPPPPPPSTVPQLPFPAPAGSPSPTLTVDRNFVTGLNNPWDVGFAADGTMFFTERTGEINVRLTDGTVRELLSAPPSFLPGGEGGMLGLEVDPLFASNRFIYTCFTSSEPGGNGDVRVVRWTVANDLVSVALNANIVTGMPRSTGRHSGCRPRFKPGTDQLFIGTGDAAIGTNPQDLNSLGGKVLRVTRDGNPYPGNPFGTRIFNYGHRNVQGVAFAANGSGMSVEHGTDRDDEVNLIVPGDFGWDPVPGYNETVPMTRSTGAWLPVWSSGFPTIAPSGATFLTGSQWEGWDGALAVAVLKGQHLRIMFPDANGFIGANNLVASIPGGAVPRLRSAVQGPDGNLYITTDVGGGGGAIWQVVPS
jgi:glucose/arabinose dehydrogenase